MTRGVDLNDGGVTVQQQRNVGLVREPQAEHLGKRENDIQRYPELRVHLAAEVLVPREVETAHVPVDLADDGVLDGGQVWRVCGEGRGILWESGIVDELSHDGGGCELPDTSVWMKRLSISR